MWQDALKYLFSSKGDYRLHSPFVYDFFQDVIRGKNSDEGKVADSIRKQMLQDPSSLIFEDLGAGSRNAQKDQPVSTRVKDLARRASRRRNEGEFLLRLFRFCQPEAALELGTQLGISTIYQKLGWPKAKLTTIEGIPQLAELAARNFRQAGLDINLIQGKFDEVLEGIVYSKNAHLDYVFIDGNHQYEATIRYFDGLLPYMKAGGLMLFDDIYWSQGMKKAWKRIMAHPEVSVSIDVFRFGLCFVRRPQAREHFRLRSLKLLL